jgi:hypothetical protein
MIGSEESCGGGGGVNALDAIDNCNLVHPCSCLQQTGLISRPAYTLQEKKDELFSICGGRILAKV